MRFPGLQPVVVLGLLAGCAHHLGSPAVTYGEGAALPLVHPTTDDDRWYVPVDTGTLGERLFFFDTGYSYSTCDDALIAELGLTTHGHVVVHGEAGDIAAAKATLPPFTVAGHEVRGLTCLVRDLGTTSSIDDPKEVAVAGVLGADLLRRFDVVVDPGEPAISLLQPGEHSLRRSDEGVVRLRREYRFGLRFLVPVEVADQRIWPVVDTGATGTHVDGRRLNLEPTWRQADVPVRASGATGGVVRDLVYFRVDEVAIGGRRYGPLMLTDRPRAPWTPGLLGLDVLARFEQEYDFRRGLARFSPVRPAAVPSFVEWQASMADDAEAEAAATEAAPTP